MFLHFSKPFISGIDKGHMIRAYTSEDKEKLVALLRLNTPQYFHREEEEDFIYYLEQHAQNYFVVEDTNTIIGSGGINYLADNREARISWDIVHPDYQGKGIGRLLTQFRMDLIKTNPEVDVIVVRTTQLVYKFYERMGFILERTEKDFWAKGFDLYQMKIPLKTDTAAGKA
jgi:ribosomal protein S18 acetylase RimI-like enzyme